MDTFVGLSRLERCSAQECQLICCIMKWFTDTQQAEAFFKHDYHTGVWCLQPPDKHTKGFIIKQWDDQIILKILTD